MSMLPSLFPHYTFKMNMAWERELIFSYNFLSPLLSSCVPTTLWLQGRARRVGLCNQKQLPMHFQKVGVWPSLGEASVYILQFPSVLTSIQTTTVQSTNHRLNAWSFFYHNNWKYHIISLFMCNLWQCKLKKFGSQFEHNAEVASRGMNVKFCRETL